MRFRRGFSDPAFECGQKSEHDRAVEIVTREVLKVLDELDLTHIQRSAISDTAARNIIPKLNEI